VRIEVTGAGLVLTKALRGDVRRRLLLSMSRFGREVHGVTAHLAESHNPLGGVDQGCRVRARLRSGLVLRAEAINGQIETAVGRSAARLALRVAEALDGHGGRRLTRETALSLRPAASTAAAPPVSRRSGPGRHRR
jgi:ribosome-associated translation inhibitor RaiA